MLCSTSSHVCVHVWTLDVIERACKCVSRRSTKPAAQEQSTTRTTMGQCISSSSRQQYAPPTTPTRTTMGQGSSSSSSRQQYAQPPVLWEQYASPLSAADMVALATSLLAHPHWGPSLRHTDREYLLEIMKGTVSTACPHLADACATGVALAVLAFCHGTWRLLKEVDCDKMDNISEEAVAAFYTALAQPTCTVEMLTIKSAAAFGTAAAAAHLGRAAFGTAAAAAHLGRCLNVNSTIKTLKIWDIEGFHGEAVWTAFSHALTSNATLRSLDLRGRSYSRHVGAALADSNKLSALTRVSVTAGIRNTLQATLEDMEMWGNILKHNSTIIDLWLEFWLPQGGLLVPVCKALLTNTTLQRLEIGHLSDYSYMDTRGEMPKTYDNADALRLAAMLRTNQTLTRLYILNSGIVCNALVVEQGLLQNISLETLSISMDAECAQALMNAFTPGDGAPNNLSPQIKYLRLGSKSSPGSQCFPSAVALGNMLASNKTLTSLHLGWAPYNNQEWAETILTALASNQTLQRLYLNNCRGVDGGLVYNAFLELLESNICITELDLDGTPLHEEGKAQAVEAAVEANKEYGAALKNVPTVPTTSCRLVLCGYPFAGKTTLLQTMMSRHSSHALSVTTNQRTRGIDIQALTIADLIMWVWDFAGQREFHPLQDFIFPNATSVHAATAFVFTFNPITQSGHGGEGVASLKTEDQFAQEFSYWLKFIRSNAKQRPGTTCKPLVLVVVTHKDQVVNKFHEMQFDIGLQDWVHDVVVEFKDMISPDECQVFFIDATNKDDLDFSNFEQHVINMFRKRTLEVHQVPIVCDAIARALGGSGSQQQKPIMSFADFSKICESAVEASINKGNRSQQEALRKLMSGTKGKAARVIAAFLRDAGEVLYFSDLDFLVRNPRWFAHGILGYLIDIVPQDNATATHNHVEGTSQSASKVVSVFRSGLVSKKSLDKLLQNAITTVGLAPAGTSTDQLIQLMEKLDLCYRTGEKYLMPALLPDKDGKAERGECKREWLFDLPRFTSKCIFVNRRLQCSDRLRTFITPGFFPRLQVVLQRKANEWNIEHTGCGKPKQVCELEKYFCRLRHRGMEILVEHSGSYDYFVDIMVKSYESREDTEKFLKSEIIDEIRRLCASSKGCQGVTLAEGIIRPDCVGEGIISCRYRQSLLVAELKEGMATIPKYKCYWEKVEDEKGTMLLPADMHDPQRLLDGVPQEETCECYPDWNVKRGKKRGLAVIISMEKYKSGDRSGGSEDRENLKALAQSLHFDFKDHVMVDYRATDVIRALKTIAQEKVLEEHESFVCFVNGHGASIGDGSEDHYFKDQDDEMLFLDSIVRPFRECKHLQDKPKVFFVNSCRGSNMLLADDEEQCGTSEQQQPASQQVAKEAREYKYVRKVKDCLIVFSTSGRCVSARDPTDGTVFVCALTNAFRDNRERLDVQGIVCRATNEVAAQQHEWKKKGGDVKVIGQCPVHVSSLTKLLYWR